MSFRDRIRRWWSPAKWRDEHPEVSDGEGFGLGAERRLIDTVGKGGSTAMATDTRTITPTSTN
jgi:hypothetical protein